MSRASRDALAILGAQIKTARIERQWTQTDLAARIGIDFKTLAAVERGAPNVAVGTVFNAAFTVGVNLFGLGGDELALARRRGEETLALLPKQSRATRRGMTVTTISEASRRSRATPPTDAFVWVWLPDATDPVVAGQLRLVDRQHRFIYGRTYLDNPAAISLYGPELPLQPGWQDPPEGLDMAGCLRDASPASYGQRVIDIRLAGGKYGDAADVAPATKLTYLLESGSDRIGAMDFQHGAAEYVARDETATLGELHSVAHSLERGDLSATLSDAFVDGTAVGGARPKVLIRDGGTSCIAKLSQSTDPYPVVKAEGAAMALARRVGIDVPRTRVTRSLGRDVLLVERFDRPGAGRRRMMVSALTMLGFGDFLGARYSSYAELVDVLRRNGRHGDKAGRDMFERVVFNIAVGNNNDHARNHAAFWDGEQLELTPAYDVCPQLRSGTESRQAMDISTDGNATASFQPASTRPPPTDCPASKPGKSSTGWSQPSVTAGRLSPTKSS